VHSVEQNCLGCAAANLFWQCWQLQKTTLLAIDVGIQPFDKIVLSPILRIR
jgi:hypothetical protein